MCVCRELKSPENLNVNECADAPIDAASNEDHDVAAASIVARAEFL
jgi:ribonuclease HIII